MKPNPSRAAGLAALALAACLAHEARASTACTEAVPAVDARVYTLHPAGAAPTGSIGCEIGDTIANDDVTGVNVTERFFEISNASDWVFRERVTFNENDTGEVFVEQDAGGGIGFLDGIQFGNPNLNPVVGSGENGASETWIIDPAALEDNEQLMLVFKGGTNVNPAPIIAYLMDKDETTGTYTSPFTGKQTQIVAISHITAYTRVVSDPPTPVPVPAGLPLMLSGLCGLFVVGRRTGRA